MAEGEARASTIDWTNFNRALKDKHVSHESSEIVSRLTPTLPGMMVRGTVVGALAGAVIGRFEYFFARQHETLIVL